MSIKSIRLHHFPGVRSARVAWLLHELSMPFELVPVHLFKGEQYLPEFRALNAGHSVPVLEFETLDGAKTTMLESGAIVSLLADLWPETRLAPPISELKLRSKYLQTIHLCSATLDMILWQIRVHEEILPIDERDKRSSERYRIKFVTEAEPRLADMLSTNQYACGSQFSAADCMIGHAVIWARMYGMCMGTPFDAYLQRIASRPAFQQAFADTVDIDLQPAHIEHLRGLFNG